MKENTNIEEDWESQYQKVDQIGKGTYGSVYRCKHISDSKKIVAIKKMKLENENEGIPATTLREIAILEKINHPNILKFQHIKFYPHKILLCFDYFPYDLKAYLKAFGKKLDENKIASIIYQVLKGLDHLHSQRILHRDLKPHNILINPEAEQVKIADFGLSRVYNIPIRPYTKEICKQFH